MADVDEREYRLNSLTMTWWRFKIYQLQLLVRKFINFINRCETYSGKNYEFTTGWSGISLEYKHKDYNSRSYIMIYFIWGKLFLYISKSYKELHSTCIEGIMNSEFYDLTD